jgi:hypothetical protein
MPRLLACVRGRRPVTQLLRIVCTVWLAV